MHRRKEKKSEVWINHEAMERLKNWVLNRPAAKFESKTDRSPRQQGFDDSEDSLAS